MASPGEKVAPAVVADTVDRYFCYRAGHDFCSLFKHAGCGIRSSTVSDILRAVFDFDDAQGLVFWDVRVVRETFRTDTIGFLSDWK
ncbi:hypothetical protein J6590_076547 [Homalodisca vitripennis]|nr:hypothetical protein J6590_076547 [Homalodisca vitripennis]